MSDHTRKEVDLFGKKQIFRALSGTVISTNQRSDTYVSGSGNNGSVGGSGGGKMSISSTVVVTSDIWIRGLSGQEYRLRFKEDIPVCEGNIIHAIDIVKNFTERISTFNQEIQDFRFETHLKEEVVSRVLLYNNTTGEWFYIGELDCNVRNAHLTKMSLLLIPVSTIVGGIIGSRYGRYSYDNYATFGGIVGFLLGLLIVGGLYVNIKYGITSSSDWKKLGGYFRDNFMRDLDAVSQKFTLANTTEIPVSLGNGSANSEGHKAFCTQCGNAIAKNAAFCGGCGEKLAE